MKNIPLLVNIEGQDSKVSTDWLAIMATLKKRGLGIDDLEVVYFELCAGMRVTTRGLGLAKANPVDPFKELLYEPKFSDRDYAGMFIV